MIPFARSTGVMALQGAVLVSALAVGSQARAEILIGMDSPGDGLVQINPLNGDTTVLTAVIGGGIIGGLAYDPFTETLYASSTSEHGLYTIDIDTGVATLVGFYGVPSPFMHGIEFDSSTGTLYGHSFTDSILYEIDTTSGAATPIGPTGAPGFGSLGYDASTGTMYLVSTEEDDVYTVDLGTGMTTFVGDLGNPGLQIGVAMAYSPTHGMLASANQGLQDSLWSIDLDTGMPTQIGTMDTNNVIGLVLIPESSDNAPAFLPPTPCEETVMASVGAEIQFTISVSDDDLGDDVTLDAVGVPAGASHNRALPATDNPLTVTFSWTPGNADVGEHLIVYTATDGVSTTTCTVTVSVAECHLALGTGIGEEYFEIGGHVFDTQLDNIVASYPVLLDDIPTFPIPRRAREIDPGAQPAGQRGGPYVLFDFTAQVVMFNPQVFPQNPEQSTPGLMITVWSDGTMTSKTYGERDGMDIWLETFVGDDGRGYFRIPFSIDGM